MRPQSRRGSLFGEEAGVETKHVRARAWTEGHYQQSDLQSSQPFATGRKTTTLSRKRSGLCGRADGQLFSKVLSRRQMHVPSALVIWRVSSLDRGSFVPVESNNTQRNDRKQRKRTNEILKTKKQNNTLKKSARKRLMQATTTEKLENNKNIRTEIPPLELPENTKETKAAYTTA